MIPVPKDVKSTKNNDDIFSDINNDLIGASRCQSIDDNLCTTSSSSLSLKNDNTIDNFLAKMDSSIANVKNDIKKSQQQSS